MNERLQALSDAGVAVWLDDLSRERIKGDGLQRLIAERDVVGVTTNPTIFASALAKGEAYDDQVRELAAAGKDVHEAVFEITTADVGDAADVFREVYDRTNGYDGRVSIEVSPELAELRGLRHGGWATLISARNAIEARVLVTDRIPPLRVGGAVVHQVGLPYHWGPNGLVTGDAANDLTSLVMDPNVNMMETKALACDVRPGRRPRGPARAELMSHN